MGLTQVSTAGIKDDAVTGAKLPGNAIGASEIAPDAITGGKIADDASDSEHYTDGSIDTAHIADLNVTTAKIAADAITGAKIADDAVGSEHIEVLDAALQFGDSVKAQFGAGTDLEIYHNGSNSYVANSTGQFILEGDDIVLMNSGRTENLARFQADAGVELYFNNSTKLETRAGDVLIHDDLRIQDNNTINVGTLDDLKIYHDGSNSYLDNATGNLYIRGGGNAISIRTVDNEQSILIQPNGAVELYHDNTKQVETYDGGLWAVADDDKFTSGAGKDFNFYQSSNGHAYITSVVGGGSIHYSVASANDQYWATNDAWRLRLDDDGHLRPYDNNSYKLGIAGSRWQEIYCTNSTINTSDRTKKNTIVTSDLGLSFINKLKPVSYKFNDGESGRTHYGLIAQDVETTLSDISKSTTDFAGFIKSDIPDRLYSIQDEDKHKIPEGKKVGDVQIPANTEYGLRYGEFIAPLIKAVQELSAEVETLKTEVAALKAG